jgi:hypothetical protein
MFTMVSRDGMNGRRVAEKLSSCGRPTNRTLRKIVRT